MRHDKIRFNWLILIAACLFCESAISEPVILNCSRNSEGNTNNVINQSIKINLDIENNKIIIGIYAYDIVRSNENAITAIYDGDIGTHVFLLNRITGEYTIAKVFLSGEKVLEYPNRDPFEIAIPKVDTQWGACTKPI